MKFRESYMWILGLTVVGVFLFSLAVGGRLETPEQRAIAFVTLGLDQSRLSGEVSSYEIQRALEHFSNVMVGWTLDPSFIDEFTTLVGPGYDFSAERQEKQNLILTVRGPVEDMAPAVALVNLLKQRLMEYNRASRSGYTVAVEREMIVSTQEANWRKALGITLLVVVLESMILTFWDRRRS